MVEIITARDLDDHRIAERYIWHWRDDLALARATNDIADTVARFVQH